MNATLTSPADLIHEAAYPFRGAAGDYDPLLDLVGDARLVLLGEATHGTHEFHRARAQITKRLIREKRFTAVAVDADWPDAYGINCFVRGKGRAQDAIDALAGFRRFPAWIWRNADVLDFVGWLRDHNDSLPADAKVGFYGLDLYSMHASIEAALALLDEVDAEGARRARSRYSGFEHFGQEPQECGYAAGFGLSRTLESEVIEDLIDLRRRAGEEVRRDGARAAGEDFYAEQNASLMKNAEEYYRAMFRGRVAAWNLRDRHMAETLGALAEFLSRDGRAKLVVWTHNAHLGDARATQLGRQGEWNVGQLARQRYGLESILVGFTTYAGSITAASEWGGEAERKHVRPALETSYEALFHATGIPRFLFSLREGGEVLQSLREPMLERAIGIIYQPETELASHYFYASLPSQFDAVIHFDHTRAVEPLERTFDWGAGESFREGM